MPTSSTTLLRELLAHINDSAQRLIVEQIIAELDVSRAHDQQVSGEAQLGVAVAGDNQGAITVDQSVQHTQTQGGDYAAGHIDKRVINILLAGSDTEAMIAALAAAGVVTDIRLMRESLAGWAAPSEAKTDDTGTVTDPLATEYLEDQFALRIIKGAQSGRVVSLGACLRIGSRKAPNDLILDDKFVSRAHVRIERQGTIYQLIDLGSANGTWLNQQRVRAHQPQPLKPGDQIRIGYTLLRLEWME